MKKLFLILVLSISILVSYRYLQDCLERRKAFAFVSTSDGLLLKKKEILLNERDEFIFDDYFEILSFSETSYAYEMNDETLTVEMNGKRYDYPYRIREKEVIEVEVPVYQTIYLPMETSAPLSATDHSSDMNYAETPIQQQTSSEPYLHLLTSSKSYPLNTDIDKIISDLYSSFDSNTSVMIDYSHLNSSVSGSYPIYFLYEYKQKEMTINIG